MQHVYNLTKDGKKYLYIIVEKGKIVDCSSEIKKETMNKSPNLALDYWRAQGFTIIE